MDPSENAFLKIRDVETNLDKRRRYSRSISSPLVSFNSRIRDFSSITEQEKLILGELREKLVSYLKEKEEETSTWKQRKEKKKYISPKKKQEKKVKKQEETPEKVQDLQTEIL